MTRTKVSSTIWVFTAAWIVLLSGSPGPTDDPFLDYLTSRLKQYYADHRQEKAYLLTDRYVYKPGEDLWFKGFVMATGEKPNEPNSEDFFIKLINSKGEEIISRRYPLTGNQTSGRLLISRSLIPGRYKLVAYTGWMKNQCPAHAFTKEILVSKYHDKRFQVEALYDKAIYYAGDSLKASIRILDQTDKPIPGIEYGYTIGSFEHTEIKGSGMTGEDGRSEIQCVIPPAAEMLMMTIEIRSRKVSGDYTLIIPACTAITQVSFYPEGGRLVQGLSGIVAIRAVGPLGQPMPVYGTIIDRTGKTLQTVTTNPQGLGKFAFLPQEDTCYLKITKPSGVTRLYPLPMASATGWVLQCDRQAQDTVVFRITAPDGQPDNISYWVFSSHHGIIGAQQITFSDTAHVSIPVSGMEHGILQVSVFDQNHVLAAERLINIKNSGEPLRVMTDHRVYRSRQRVNLSLELVGSGNHADLTMLVALRNLASNRFAPGLNQIAGFIPCDTLPDLTYHRGLVSDLDLLTTRYRVINWEDVLNFSAHENRYKPKHGLYGKIYDKKDNLAQHAKVRVTHVTNYRSYETKTDETGTFQVVFGSDVIDLNSLNVDAYDALGKVSLSASIDQEYSNALRSLVVGEGESGDYQKAMDVITYGEPDLVYALRYGPGKFRKSAPESRKKYDPNQYTDYTNVLDIIQEIKPYNLINNAIVFTGSEGNIPGPMANEGAIIVINGALKGNKIDILKKLLPSDITNINISTSLIDVHKYTPLSFQGVIEITTIQGMYRYRQPTVQLGMDILNADRAFYSPDYSIESTNTSDNRKTLYWKPVIHLEARKSKVFSFYTSDVKGRYYGLVEGIDDAGKPVRCEFTFVVE